MEKINAKFSKNGNFQLPLSLAIKLFEKGEIQTEKKVFFSQKQHGFLKFGRLTKYADYYEIAIVGEANYHHYSKLNKEQFNEYFIE